MVENESNTCSMRKIILTSPKPFPEACFHNQPEEHVLHSANSFLKSLCPKKIGHWRKISDDHKSGYYQGTGDYNCQSKFKKEHASSLQDHLRLIACCNGWPSWSHCCEPQGKYRTLVFEFPVIPWVTFHKLGTSIWISDCQDSF